jgi:ferritin-like metal-binding protein YciE
MVPFTMASKTPKENLTKEMEDTFKEVNHQIKKLEKISEDEKIFQGQGLEESIL